MALGAGSIAFVGFNADGPDNLAFVALEPIAAGTVITFTDKEWNGTSFNTGESTWTWTATGEIQAGSVITMNGLAAGQTAGSNLGTIAFSDQTLRDIEIQNETIYAYIGDASAPTFLTAISNDTFNNADGSLTNTGLVQGQTAISLTSLDADADIAIYAGIRGAASFAALRSLINTPSNWVSQDGNGDQYNDGTRPDVPFVTAPFAGEPNFQTIGFAGGTATISQVEGNNGQTFIIFMLERTGGTTGAVDFSGTLGGTTNNGDFGGSKPLTFSGSFADGATTATVTIALTGDALLEADETLVLMLTDAHNNGAGTTVLGTNVVKTAIVTNDDDYVVIDGQVLSGGLTVPAGEGLIVEQGGKIQGDVLLLNPGILPSVTNSGTISGATGILIGNNKALDFTGGITIVNNAGGLIEGTARAIRATADFHGSTLKIVNAGTIMANDETIRLDDAVNAVYVVENLAGGQILGRNPQNDVMRLGSNTTVINAGTIAGALDVPGAGRAGDGVDFKSGTGSSLHNLTGGTISASRHAVTGERGLTVVNDEGGLLAGRNGSAVNIDNDATVANTVFVKNYGVMEGRSAHYEDSDGDAVDVDGLAVIENWGEIKGLGHNGYHDGEPNVSEAIAMGGGTIINHEGGMLYGYGRAIQIDNSGNGGAFAATTIENSGTIQGDGNLPTDVEPEDLAPFVERIKGGEAINIVGTYADTLTNNETGEIIGGVKLDGGDDVLVNAGIMTATGGSAIDMGEGNDSVTIEEDGEVSGQILLGAGNDTLTAVDGDLEVDGGEGDDIITTGEGDDLVLGGAGSDTIDGGEGDDELDGEEGDDVLKGNTGDDILIGGLGNDLLAGGESDDELDGGEGVDTADYSDDESGVTVDLSAGEAFGDDAGSDTLTDIENATGGSGNDTLTGDDGDNRLDGGEGNDMLKGGAGDDIILAGLGNDTIDGGEGFDTLDLSGATGPVNVNFGAGTVSGAGLGSDTFINIENLLFGSGNDIVTGGNGDDGFDGGAGDDVLKGGAGDDVVSGGEGNDNIDGGSGDDIVNGGTGDDVVKAGSGDDEVLGGEGDDEIDAGSGDDIVTAGTGDDLIDGGSGDDLIEGGLGDDDMAGGSGHDVFVFATGFGNDTISDFKTTGSSSDILEFDADLFADFASAIAAADQVGKNVVITFNADNTITLEGVQLASLAADDFRFV